MTIDLIVGLTAMLRRWIKWLRSPAHAAGVERTNSEPAPPVLAPLPNMPPLSEVAGASLLSTEWIEDLLALNHRFARDPRYIARYNAHMYSQNYEDSIIAEIFSRIGTDKRAFVEIGAGNGLENTSRLLLELGWTGLWIEGDPGSTATIRERFRHYLDRGGLRLEESLVTKDNAQSLLDRNGLGEEIDFLSIDIDMNTSHVWRALQVKPRVACIEYNASIHPTVDFEFEYRPEAIWDGSNYFGASLSVLDKIGRAKGMSLVGCDNRGVNAFFVRSDLTADHFIQPFDPVNHYEPPRYSLVTHRGHRSFVGDGGLK